MKTFGIILVILGSLSLITAMIAAANGYPPNQASGGIMIIVIGAFIISRANKKKQKEMEKKKWEDGKK